MNPQKEKVQMRGCGRADAAPLHTGTEPVRGFGVSASSSVSVWTPLLCGVPGQFSEIRNILGSRRRVRKGRAVISAHLPTIRIWFSL